MRIDDDCVVILFTEVKTVLYIDGTDQAATSIARQQQPSGEATAFLSILLGHIHNTWRTIDSRERPQLGLAVHHMSQ